MVFGVADGIDGAADAIVGVSSDCEFLDRQAPTLLLEDDNRPFESTDCHGAVDVLDTEHSFLARLLRMKKHPHDPR